MLYFLPDLLTNTMRNLYNVTASCMNYARNLSQVFDLLVLSQTFTDTQISLWITIWIDQMLTMACSLIMAPLHLRWLSNTFHLITMHASHLFKEHLHPFQVFANFSPRAILCLVLRSLVW